MLTAAMLAAPIGALAAILIHGGPFWRGLIIGGIVGSLVTLHYCG